MNIKQLPFYLFLFLFLSGYTAYGQQPKGNFFNIEQRKVFIENKGQFHTPAGQNPILYAYDGGSSKIYFTSKGLIYSISKVTWKKEPSEDDHNSIGEEEEDKKPDVESDLVNMEWINANNNPEIIAENKAPDYFSYSMKDKGGLKNVNHINGYQKLIYKNLYPGIDVEYVFHRDEGIEYTLLLHPGADISKVQMKYSDNHKLTLSGRNVHVKTLFGNIIDHAPSTFYSDNKDASIESKFVVLNTNTIGFDLGNYDNSKEVTIDPWTITPSFPNSNKIWNCQTDALGNVYLYGGDTPLLLRKYTSAGALTWTYRTTWDSDSYWLGTLITSRAGISYISSGANGEIAEISTVGALVWYNNPNGILGPLYEYWHMALNCDQTQLVVSGTLLPSPFNIAGFEGDIFNMNLTNGTIASQVQIGNEFGLLSINEGRSICSSPNGNYYFLTLDSIGCINPSLAVTYKTNSTYNFSYGSPSYAVTGNMGQNAMRATQNFLYTQNGTNIHQRDINTGVILLTATIPGGASNTALGEYSPDNSGLDIDSCGNVYAGSTNQVVEYDANLNQLNTTTTPAAVYDVAVNNNGEVIACGDGFAMSIAFSACHPPVLICSACNPPSLATSYAGVACFGSANGSATVTPSGGNSPYTYSWSPVTGNTATISGLSAGTYSCTVSDSTGCVSVTSVIITQPAAVSATFTRTQDSCYGSVNGSATANTSGGTSPYTYSWSSVGGTNITATGLSAGTYSVTITDNHGCSTLDSVIITMPPKINISLSGNDSVCRGDSAIIAATGGGTYLWSNGATTSALTIIPSSSATYTLSVTNNGCRKDTTVAIYVKASPTVTITPDTTICQGNNITLTVSGGGTYLWNTGSTTSSITVSPSLSTTYSAAISLGGCTKDTAMTVNVSTSQTLTITPPSLSACAGAPDTLTVTGTGPFTWSNGATSGTIIVYPDSTQIYSVSAGAVGCLATAADTITVFPSPSVTISRDTAICSGNSVTLTVSGGGTYLWNTGSTTSSITVSPSLSTTYSAAISLGGCTKDTAVMVTVSSSQTLTITPPSLSSCAGSPDTLTVIGTGPFTWSNGSTTATIIISPDSTQVYSVTAGAVGCSAFASDTITVIPMPNVKISSDTAVCAGNSVTLTVTGGGTYLWSNASTSSSISVTPDSTITYTATVSSGGCTKDTTVTVSVSGNQSITITPTFTLCAGTVDTISVTGTGPYLWNTGSTTNTIIIHPDSSAIYSVTVGPPGCSSTAKDTVKVKPVPFVTLQGLPRICSGANTTLVATGGGTYLWTPGGQTGSAIVVSPDTTTTYSLVVTKSGCSKDTILKVTVLPTPTPAVNGPFTICRGESVNLFASGGDFYRWTPFTTLNDSGIYDPIADPRVTTTYTVIVGDTTGCRATDSITVNVLSGASGFVCCSDTILPGGSENLTITGATSGTTFSWSPSGSLSCSTCADPTATPSVTTMYTVTVIDTNGCVSIDSVLIVVETPPGCGSLFVPDVFSPTQSVNNVLYVRGDCIKTMTFAVYDRWGNQVFVSYKLSDGWDGNYKNKPMDMGTYMYYLNVTLLDGTTVDKKGNVTLVR